MSAASPHLPGGFSWLVAGTLTTGLFSVAAQVLVPLASLLAAPTHAGRAVGFVMAGLLVGILLARTVAGVLSGLGGWSLSYWVTGAAMLGVALLLANALKAAKAAAQRQAGAAAAPAPKLSYVQVLASMGTLLKAEPRLRSRTLLGAFSFGSVSVLFSTMALLLGGPAHGLSDTAIGLIGLAGVTGALMANAAGRLADRGLAAPTTAAGVALLLASWLPLWWGGHSVWAFIAGMLLIDLALQAVHICNQNVIYALAPQARSRINAVYMTGYFIGASTGSAVGAAAWLRHGWAGACLAGLALGLCNVAALVWDRRLAKFQSTQYSSVSFGMTTENR
jgi:predicted MFS family arabinose efflux permease